MGPPQKKIAKVMSATDHAIAAAEVTEKLNGITRRPPVDQGRNDVVEIPPLSQNVTSSSSSPSLDGVGNSNGIIPSTSSGNDGGSVETLGSSSTVPKRTRNPGQSGRTRRVTKISVSSPGTSATATGQEGINSPSASTSLAPSAPCESGSQPEVATIARKIPLPPMSQKPPNKIRRADMTKHLEQFRSNLMLLIHNMFPNEGLPLLELEAEYSKYFKPALDVSAILDAMGLKFHTPDGTPAEVMLKKLFGVVPFSSNFEVCDVLLQREGGGRAIDKPRSKESRIFCIRGRNVLEMKKIAKLASHSNMALMRDDIYDQEGTNGDNAQTRNESDSGGKSEKNTSPVGNEINRVEVVEDDNCVKSNVKSDPAVKTNNQPSAPRQSTRARKPVDKYGDFLYPNSKKKTLPARNSDESVESRSNEDATTTQNAKDTPGSSEVIEIPPPASTVTSMTATVTTLNLQNKPSSSASTPKEPAPEAPAPIATAVATNLNLQNKPSSAGSSASTSKEPASAASTPIATAAVNPTATIATAQNLQNKPSSSASSILSSSNGRQSQKTGKVVLKPGLLWGDNIDVQKLSPIVYKIPMEEVVTNRHGQVRTLNYIREIFECRMCRLKFDDSRSFFNHRKPSDHLFICAICGVNFMMSCKLQEHQNFGNCKNGQASQSHQESSNNKPNVYCPEVVDISDDSD